MIRRLQGFEYRDPVSLQEAVELLAQYDCRCKILAGGTDYLVALKEGKFPAPPYLISLDRIPGISGIDLDEKRKTVRIKTGTRISEIIESPHTSELPSPC